MWQDPGLFRSTAAEFHDTGVSALFAGNFRAWAYAERRALGFIVRGVRVRSGHLWRGLVLRFAGWLIRIASEDKNHGR